MTSISSDICLMGVKFLSRRLWSCQNSVPLPFSGRQISSIDKIKNTHRCVIVYCGNFCALDTYLFEFGGKQEQSFHERYLGTISRSFNKRLFAEMSRTFVLAYLTKRTHIQLVLALSFYRLTIKRNFVVPVKVYKKTWRRHVFGH